MHLELTDEEADALRDLLASYLGDLSTEIAATDNPDFRRELRHRRDLLLRVRAAVPPPSPPGPPRTGSTSTTG